MIWSEAVAAVFFGGMAIAHRPMALILLAFGSAIPSCRSCRLRAPRSPTSWTMTTTSPGRTAWLTLGVHAGIAVGPVIGGIIYAFTKSASLVFALNAATFLVSLVLTVSVRARFQKVADAEEADAHEGIGAGLVYLWREPTLRRLSIAWFVFVLAMGWAWWRTPRSRRRSTGTPPATAS